MKPNASGQIVDRFGQPLAFARIKVLGTETGNEVAHRVTDEQGRYYILVRKGTYHLSIEKKLASGEYEHVFTTEPMRTRRGVLNQKITLR